MGRKKIRKALFTSVVFLMVCLSSCGKKLVNETEILEDLNAASVELSTYHNVEFTSIEIEKRKTDEVAKTDEVYIWVTGESESLACKAAYLMQYVLYNEGWELESIDVHNAHEWTITPKKGADQAMIEEILRENYGFDSFELSSVKESLSEGLAQYCYKLTSYYNYMTRVDTVMVDCSLDPFTFEWVCIHDPIDQQDTWDLNGTWTATTNADEEAYIELKIDGFTNSSFTGSCYIERMDRVPEDSFGFVWKDSPVLFADDSGEFLLDSSYNKELYIAYDANGNLTNLSDRNLSIVIYFGKDAVRVSDLNWGSDLQDIFMSRN